jgi:hypothetical protein
MQRRTAVKQLIVMTTGALLIPSCVREAKKVSIALDHLKLNADHESLVASITETLLPTSDTPGAKELKLHEFVLRMVDDCYSPDQQKEFQQGLQDFDKYAADTAGDSFTDMNEESRLKFLQGLEKKKGDEQSLQDDEKAIVAFYRRTKGLAIRGYMSSEPVMTKLLYYKMIPGRFNGCVEIKDPNDYQTIYG